MHLWYEHTGEVDTQGLMIRDEDVAASQGAVRALVAARLEQIWAACQPHITGEAGKPDPRFIEAGIRVTDRLSKLYRLDTPQQQGGEDDAEQKVDARILAMNAVAALEARIRGGEASQAA